jgi:hypothetical protein
MKTLDLVLKAKWFDMIESGEKKEEYREIKPFWIRRLCGPYGYRQYEQIRFSLGYAKNRKQMTFNCDEIKVGPARPEWSDNWQGDVFVVSIGKRIS